MLTVVPDPASGDNNQPATGHISSIDEIAANLPVELLATIGVSERYFLAGVKFE